MLSHSAILTWMLVVPVIGSLAVLALPPGQAKKARGLAMGFCLATVLLSVLAAWRFDWTVTGYGAAGETVQMVFRHDWIRSLGVECYLGVDGISMPLLLLTTCMMAVACWASYGIGKSQRGYFALLLSLLACAIGVVVSLDLLVFYIFFELSLVPVYFLIGIWGGAKRDYAAVKFFLYSLLGSLAVLIAIVGIYYQTRDARTGRGVFDMIALASDSAVRGQFAAAAGATGFAAAGFWLLMVGFAIRMAAVPLHNWLADALAEAPTPVCMVVAAIVVNGGAYGLLRIAYPIFPEQAASGWFYVGLIGVVSIVYGALVAMAQKDFKRLAALTSVSQMGFVLLGLAVMTPIGTLGAVFQMIAQGISGALLFFIAGVIDDRAHHREIPRLGGLWAQMPRYTGWSVVGFFAAMGLPGLCGFVGRWLVLLGTFSAAKVPADPAQRGYILRQVEMGAHDRLIWLGVVAAAGMALTAGYLLWTLQRVYMGAPKPEYHNFPRLTSSEQWILAVLGVAAIVLGVLPMVVLEPIRPAIEGLLRMMTH